MIKSEELKNIDFKYNFKVYWSLLKPYTGLLAILLGVILVIEASYIADNLLFKTLIDRATDFSNNTITQSTLTHTLLIIALIFVGVAILRTVLKFLHIHLINIIDAHLISDLKQKFFNHITTLSYNFHTTHKTGSLISRLSRGGRAIESMTDVIVFNFAPLIFKLLVAGITLYIFSKGAGIIAVVTVLTFILYSLYLQKKQEPLNIAANDAEDKEKASLGDFFTNIDSIKHFAQEETVQGRFKHLVLSSKQAMLRKWNMFRVMDAGQSIILAAGTFAIVYAGITDFMAGRTTVGSLVFVYTTYSGLLSPLYGFLHGIRGYNQSMADFEVLFKYGKIENEVKDLPDSTHHQIKKGSIEFKDVEFSYGKREIFKKLNLKIKPGQKIALVGHSGSGKTTVVKLLYRLYDIDSGDILIDGRPIKNYKAKSLRSQMAIVPQECALFDDTIYNNVAFSKPGATREEVLNAMRFAQLDKIINNFPQKEETIVGERGVKLSGGEKQRVSIARAILADTKILVLDEATSALDSQTEHEIQRDLKALMKGRTSIIIAHRLSTIMQADKIIVLENGNIVQSGKHSELLKKKGHYKTLWNLQRGGYLE